MSFKKQLIQDIKKAYEKNNVEYGTNNLLSFLSDTQERIIVYLDNTMFQKNVKDFLDLFLEMKPAKKGDWEGEVEYKVLTTKEIAKESEENGRWIMNKGSLEEKLLFSDIYSNEGKIIHPKIEIVDKLEEFPFKKAADYYLRLLDKRKNVLKRIEENQSHDPDNLKMLKDHLIKSYGPRAYGLFKKGLKSKNLNDERLIMNLLLDATTKRGDYFLLSDDPDICEQTIKVLNFVRYDMMSHELAKRYHKNPHSYNVTKMQTPKGFFVEFPKEEIKELVSTKRQNSRILVKGSNNFLLANDYYGGCIFSDGKEFYETKNKNCQNTDLFGDLNCEFVILDIYNKDRSKVEKEKIGVLFYEKKISTAGLFASDFLRFLDKDWANCRDLAHC
ncbi:MAG: hypothetical protein V1660_00085 [archaeon]